MLNGCICCTVRKDLSEILKKFVDNGLVKNLDGVIIETTGMADPAPVISTFYMMEEIVANYTLDGVVTVLDALNVEHHLDKEVKEGCENEALEQVAFANKILLNKIDLVSEEVLTRIEARIKGINPCPTIIRTVQSNVDMSEVMNMKAFDLSTLDEKLK